MKAYVIGFGKTNFATVKVYDSKAVAVSGGNYGTLFCSAEELEASNVEGWQMVDVYNHHNPSNKIAKFSDRTTACRRIFALAQAKAEGEGAVAEKKAKAPKEKKPKATGESSKRGRKSEYSGKKLTATVAENPRRAGSSGHKSMAIILGKPGIVFEDFLAAGGRAVDLRWDIAHNAVKIA